MLICSTSVSVDGFIADREGAFGGRSLTRGSFVSASRRSASSPRPLQHPRPGLRKAMTASDTVPEVDDAVAADTEER
jgi:hypothetical protein